MSTHIPPALINRLGALCVALGDHHSRAVSTATGLAPGRAAALVSIGADPGIGATRLAPILGLTQSVVARLCDDLAREGLLEKRPGRTARDVALVLTAAGQTMRARILALRAEATAKALSAVPAADLAALAPVIDHLLTALTPDAARADHICRLCDEDACGLADCPVERAARPSV